MRLTVTISFNPPGLYHWTLFDGRTISVIAGSDEGSDSVEPALRAGVEAALNHSIDNDYAEAEIKIEYTEAAREEL